MNLLLVDDDSAFRTLLRTTFEAVDVDVAEAADAAEAATRIAECTPDVVVLDVGMPGVDGLSFCRQLKDEPETEGIRVVLLTGLSDVEAVACQAGADALLLKPFRPLELLGVVERLAGGRVGLPLRAGRSHSEEEQLILYARDLRQLVELERSQRTLLECAYRDTVTALTTALETKDSGTGHHCQRVQRYACELARTLDPLILRHPSVEYGFLLHDIGKIGIPDQILHKPGPLTDPEQRLMESHTVLGEQMIAGVAFLNGPGAGIVRSHHERWDGNGYPDGLAGVEIPLCARIFAVADALDAMTTDRPYRLSLDWASAQREIVACAGGQFDPDVVDAFRESEHVLYDIRRELLPAA
jgi:response regulator RpfG family c-di-GMP phosphodiesterase